MRGPVTGGTIPDTEDRRLNRTGDVAQIKYKEGMVAMGFTLLVEQAGDTEACELVPVGRHVNTGIDVPADGAGADGGGPVQDQLLDA